MTPSATAVCASTPATASTSAVSPKAFRAPAPAPASPATSTTATTTAIRFTGTASPRSFKHAVDWFNANGGINFAAAIRLARTSASAASAPSFDGSSSRPAWMSGPSAPASRLAERLRPRRLHQPRLEQLLRRVHQPGDRPGREPLTRRRCRPARSSATATTVERTYKAIQLQASYRLFNRLHLGGNYTWSELPATSKVRPPAAVRSRRAAGSSSTPSTRASTQNAPVGFLSGDQTHKLRVWAAMDFPLGPAGVLNVSVLERFDSGRRTRPVADGPCPQRQRRLDFRRTATDPAAGDVRRHARSRAAAPSPTSSASVAQFRWEDITAHRPGAQLPPADLRRASCSSRAR